jgi:multimeric flavodoxin WrbA
MEVIAFNGSPRKKRNTSLLLEKALEGAASTGATTRQIRLYDLNFKGCKSCFGCKVINGEGYGYCSQQDELTPLLRDIAKVDAIILGSPIYFGSVTGEMRTLLERLIFPFFRYHIENGAMGTSLFPRKIQTGFIYTTGVPEEPAREQGYYKDAARTEGLLKMIFGNSESMFCHDTYQFDDYSKIDQDFDVASKAARRRTQFPLDCRKAFEMGVRLATAAAASAST